MFKILSVALLALIACNSGPDKKGETAGAAPASPSAKSYTWSKDDENTFLDGCIDSARVHYGEQAGFAYCNCVLGELKKTFPTMDSASSVLMDLERAKEFAARCAGSVPKK